MTNAQVKAIQARQIEQLAQAGGGDEQRAKAKCLYRRLVRFVKRYYRWGERGHDSYYMRYWAEDHEREGELLAAIGKRLDGELAAYGMHLSYPGLYPIVKFENGAWAIDLVWY